MDFQCLINDKLFTKGNLKKQSGNLREASTKILNSRRLNPLRQIKHLGLVIVKTNSAGANTDR